jgi:hypothetical protein
MTNNVTFDSITIHSARVTEEIDNVEPLIREIARSSGAPQYRIRDFIRRRRTFTVEGFILETNVGDADARTIKNDLIESAIAQQTSGSSLTKDFVYEGKTFKAMVLNLRVVEEPRDPPTSSNGQSSYAVTLRLYTDDTGTSNP